MHMRAEECGVFFYEDEDFAALTIHFKKSMYAIVFLWIKSLKVIVPTSIVVPSA